MLATMLEGAAVLHSRSAAKPVLRPERWYDTSTSRSMVVLMCCDAMHLEWSVAGHTMI